MSVRSLRLVLGDQLSLDLASLRHLSSKHDVVLMVEVREETTYVPHHPQKIALILSAMRHFAQELEAQGVRVDYVRLDDRENTGSFTGELERARRRHRPERVIVTEPGEWRVREMMDGWDAEILDDDRFLCSRADFTAWAKGRKQLRMEWFYREMRRRTGWLMEGKSPLGGRWNFDAENRKSVPQGLQPPERLRFRPDAQTREVLDLVRERFPAHFGSLEGFCWGVTRGQARAALAHFVSTGLPSFGDYQDAMKRGEDFLFHGLLSPYLNIGLLSPREVCEAALAARAPLNAKEGFIRQILGWREYVRGVYWLRMPEYAETNFLGGEGRLPDLYWGAATDMACLRECVDATRRNAYAHHIQRLMVTGNFALLAGIRPKEIEDWYLAVYVDAFEWVELPNTHGMVMYADGGLLASKPYAASGAYIDRMSDYCKDCRHDPKGKSGPDACPFNYLYWDFLMRNEAKLAGNPRLAMPYRTLARFDDARKHTIRQDASGFLAGLGVLPKS